MARNMAARVANPTISEVLARFLAEQRDRLTPRTFAQYESVVELLQHCLNGYGHQNLDEPESKLFDRFYNARGAAHREFCDVFGPGHILPNVGMFLDYFMARKVLAGKELLRAAGTVTSRLATWLAGNGHATVEDAEATAERGREAARTLPRAAELASLLHEFAQAQERGDARREVEDYFTLTRVQRDGLWLTGFSDGREFGPIIVPEEIRRRCEVGWTICGVLGRFGRSWRLVEASNVYPRG